MLHLPCRLPRRTSTLAILLCLALFLPSSASATGPGSRTTPTTPTTSTTSTTSTTPAASPPATPAQPPALERVAESARAAHKALVVEVGASWCGPCKLLESQVLPHPTVQQALREVIFVRYDAEVGPGRAAARALSVHGYPTLIARAQDGTEIDRLQGVPGVSEMARWLGRVAAESEPTATLEARAQADKPDGRTLLTLASRYRRRGEPDRAQQALQRALQLATGKDEATAAQADYQLRLSHLRAVLRDEPRKAMTAHLLRYPSGPESDQAFQSLSRLGPADPEARLALGKYLDAHLSQRDLVNQAIYACLRAGAYDEAERAARALLSAAPQSALYLDTLAEVLHLRGDQRAALRLSDEALAAAGRDREPGAAELRAELLRNQERFRRGHREPPPDFARESDEPFPWE